MKGRCMKRKALLKFKYHFFYRIVRIFGNYYWNSNTKKCPYSGIVSHFENQNQIYFVLFYQKMLKYWMLTISIQLFQWFPKFNIKIILNSPNWGKRINRHFVGNPIWKATIKTRYFYTISKKINIHPTSK